MMTNDFEAGRLAAIHLIEQRCSDYLYMGISNFRNDMRFRGFAFELHQRGVELSGERHLRVDVDRDESDPAGVPRAAPPRAARPGCSVITTCLRCG